jgi:hypothetical protein
MNELSLSPGTFGLTRITSSKLLGSISASDPPLQPDYGSVITSLREALALLDASLLSSLNRYLVF